MIEWLSELAQEPYYEFALILLFAAVAGAIGQFLKQPLIVMFIALGIILGPSLLNIVHSKEYIHLLAEIGIAVLLFIVGLKLDIRIIKSVGKIALLTGLGQVFFTSAVGFIIALSLGFSTMHSFYIAVALTFSSTIIIVKLLSDKKDIDSLYGQISIGFLIVQDIIVILVMIVLASLRQAETVSLAENIIRTIISGIALLVATFAMMKWVLPKLSRFLARSQEMLTLFAIAWAVALAAGSELIGFSGEVGAFLAGVSLASSKFRDVIGSRLVSLRDFLLLFFFVHLGSNLNLAVIGTQVPSAIMFSVFVLVGNPLIVLIIMGIMGYRKRTAFMAGLTVAQISEFSLIFAGLGLAIGHITEDVVGLITLVGLITIGISTYLILYSHNIYDVIKPALRIFERKDPFSQEKYKPKPDEKYEIVIFGLGRFGSVIAEILDEHPEANFFGIDFDPDVVKYWKDKGANVIYGDMEDPDILEQVPLKGVKCILSTVSDKEHSKNLVRKLRVRGHFRGKIFLTAKSDKDFEELQTCRASEVLLPQKMAAVNFYNNYMVTLLEED